MGSTHDCPLCTDAYENETDLRVHLEVEHRKSELAKRLVDVRRGTIGPDPVAEDERTRSEERPTPTV